MSVAVAQRVKHDLLDKIRRGNWRLHQPIPTERELMAQYAASRSAVRTALKSLEDEGILVAVQGSGRTVLSQPPPERLALGLLLRGGEIGSGQGALIYQQIQQSVLAAGHHLVSFTINVEDGDLLNERDVLPMGSVQGFLVLAHQYLAEDILALSKQKPVVVLGRDVAALGVPSFGIDWACHAALAVQELWAQGHRQIGLMYEQSPFHAQIGSEMRRGWELVHRLVGIEPDSNAVFRVPLTEDAGTELYTRLRAEHPSLTAIVSYGRPPLTGMARAAAQRGERLGAEVSAICLCDISSDPVPASDYAYFRCPLREFAADAVKALLASLRGERGEAVHRTYRGRFQAGPSAGPVHSSLSAQ